jgi:hypothetical protein
MKRLLGIYREPECSPGRHRSNDTLLLDAVAADLRERGARVTLIAPDWSGPSTALGASPADGELIFSMCQGAGALQQLREWEIGGAAIVNSPRAALNTYRDRLPGILQRAGIPYPRTVVVSTAAETEVSWPLPIDAAAGVWLKRGDMHASVSADVQRIGSVEQFRDGLADFRSRGVARAAVQEHRAGTEIKFYGVTGEEFFHWFVTRGSAGGAAIDVAALRGLAQRAADAAGLDVYGGDIIVEPSGLLTVIDLNDWPSFAPCRAAAAAAIADNLMRRAHGVWNPGLVPSANQSAV